jgi:hypothetical protein
MINNPAMRKAHGPTIKKINKELKKYIRPPSLGLKQASIQEKENIRLVMRSKKLFDAIPAKDRKKVMEIMRANIQRKVKETGFTLGVTGQKKEQDILSSKEMERCEKLAERRSLLPLLEKPPEYFQKLKERYLT